MTVEEILNELKAINVRLFELKDCFPETDVNQFLSDADYFLDNARGSIYESISSIEEYNKLSKK